MAARHRDPRGPPSLRHTPPRPPRDCPTPPVARIPLASGTYPVWQILAAFPGEPWLHNHPKAPKAQRDEIKRNLRDMFYVDADDWKEMVYEQAVDGCLRAIEHLGETRTYA